MAPTEEAEEEENRGPDKDGWENLMKGLIRKRVLTAGSGVQPELKQDVRCSFEVRLANGPANVVLQRRRKWRYRIGEGEAPPCLELGLRHMLPGEECEIFGASRMAWGPPGLPSAAEDEVEIPPDADVQLRVVLHECFDGEGADYTWDEKMQEICWRKENGNDHFQHKQFHKSARCYVEGLKIFESDYAPPEDMPNADSAVMGAIALAADIGANLAAVHLETGAVSAARDAARAALQISPNHVKALYRAAKAYFLLDEFEECELALTRALGVEPENAAVQRLEAELKRKKRKYADKSKRLAESMMSSMESSNRPVLDVPQVVNQVVNETEHSEDSPGLLQKLHTGIVSWFLEERRLVLGTVACLLLLGVLCAALPQRHWRYCIPGVMLAFPVATGMGHTSSSPGCEPKKQKET